MLRIFASIGIVACAACAPAPAQAASFDCARARAVDEVTVCRNAALSALDSEMGGLWFAYSRVPMLMGASGNRRDEAQAFIQRRRRCGRNVGCLTGVYRARVAELRQSVDGAMRQYTELVHGPQE